MHELQLSKKGQELIKFYEQMAQGYEAENEFGEIIKVEKEKAYSMFNISRFKNILGPIFKENNIKTVLDYGCGGSDWDKSGFSDTGLNAKQYFNLDKVFKYEPARGINEKNNADCVVCWDVLEHIFITDVSKVLKDIFSYANNVVLLNIACYEASAKLPNKENAHVTVRDPLWWKGFIDCVSMDYPNIKIGLFCSNDYENATFFNIWNSDSWNKIDNYVT